MGERLARDARAHGVPASALPGLAVAYRLATEARAPALEGEEDPRFLHPARTVLILLADTPERDPAVLAAAVVVDSALPGAEPSEDAVERWLGPRVARIRGRVPVPDGRGNVRRPEDARGRELAPVLAAAAEEARRVALAERLDHLRHLHVRPHTDEELRSAEAEARAVYLPVARRTDEGLARRYERWCRAIRRRVGTEDPPGG